MQELIKKSGTVTSLELVAEINLFRTQDGNKSEIRHADLLKIIRDEFEEEINERKISLVEYTDKKGEMRPMFELTISQATQVLVRESKFVRKAIITKLEALQTPTTQVAISIEDVLIQQLQITKSIRIEQEQMKVRQSEQDARILQIEAKNATSPDYFTIMGYAILKKRKVNVKLAAEIGRKSSVICKQKGYPIERVKDPRFGYVGSYPTEVLQSVFSAMSFT